MSSNDCRSKTQSQCKDIEMWFNAKKNICKDWTQSKTAMLTLTEWTLSENISRMWKWSEWTAGQRMGRYPYLTFTSTSQWVYCCNIKSQSVSLVGNSHTVQTWVWKCFNLLVFTCIATDFPLPLLTDSHRPIVTIYMLQRATKWHFWICQRVELEFPGKKWVTLHSAEWDLMESQQILDLFDASYRAQSWERREEEHLKKWMNLKMRRLTWFMLKQSMCGVVRGRSL